MAEKEKRKNRKVVKIHEKYDQGNIKAKFCPKCGVGVIMAEHGNRTHCGKCGYTVFKSSKPKEE